LTYDLGLPFLLVPNKIRPGDNPDDLVCPINDHNCRINDLAFLQRRTPFWARGATSFSILDEERLIGFLQL
jgi:hypothetical protein